MYLLGVAGHGTPEHRAYWEPGMGDGIRPGEVGKKPMEVAMLRGGGGVVRARVPGVSPLVSTLMGSSGPSVLLGTRQKRGSVTASVED